MDTTFTQLSPDMLPSNKRPVAVAMIPAVNINLRLLSFCENVRGSVVKVVVHYY